MILNRLTTFLSALIDEARFVISGTSPYDRVVPGGDEADEPRQPAAKSAAAGPAAVWGTYWHP